MSVNIIVLYCFIFFGIVHSKEMKCSIPYLSLASSFRPLILDTEGKLLDSDTYGQIIVPHGNNVTFSCMQNKIIDSEFNSVNVTCVDGELGANNETFEYSQAACKKRVINMYFAKSPLCNDSLVIYHFYDEGINLPNLYGAEPTSPEVFENSSKIAEICFDTDKKIPIYSHFKLSGFSINLELQPNSTGAPSLPTMDHQVTYIFNKLDKKIIKQLDHGNDISILNDTLKVTSLVPHKLFHKQLVDVSRRPHNLIGMWYSVKQGNWRNLLDDIYVLNRSSVAREFDIYMGTYKVLNLPDSNQTLTEVYLRPDKTYPIPAYVWTIVYEAKKEAGVAFVLVNNNIHIDDLEGLSVCNTMCDQIYWIKNLRRRNNFDRSNLGYMMCCDIRTFKDAVTGIPAVDELVLNQESALLRY